MKKTPFRSREPIVYGSYGSCVSVKDDINGRSTFVQSVDEFGKTNVIPDEEFTLTEELRNGVPLKEIPCSSLIGSTDPIDHPIDTEKLLETVNKVDDPE